MIILLMTLLSLSTIIFTRLLFKKQMKIASISLAVLYVYLIAWTYVIFIFDVADLGFSEVETNIARLHGGVVYHSFVQLAARMDCIPLPLLGAIVEVVLLVLVLSIVVVVYGGIETSREIIRSFRKKILTHHKKIKTSIKNVGKFISHVSIIRMNCRANC